MFTPVAASPRYYLLPSVFWSCAALELLSIERAFAPRTSIAPRG